MDKHLLGQRTRLCASGRRNWKAIEGCGGADRKEDDASHRSFLCARPSGERQHMAGECGKLPPPRLLKFLDACQDLMRGARGWQIRFPEVNVTTLIVIVSALL
ncbi:hypothetical protein B296_00018186 [Ensete ventricosum]|uniref:Uncharacterized protein n=1 Tax=Ensete ventricosum TaxID=4639 RepID=A0A426YE47_ENSVE|nr:hypothetical protein B296_00018186 [Ensete ventricosum]